MAGHNPLNMHILTYLLIYHQHVMPDVAMNSRVAVTVMFSITENSSNEPARQ